MKLGHIHRQPIILLQIGLVYAYSFEKSSEFKLVFVMHSAVNQHHSNQSSAFILCNQ